MIFLPKNSGFGVAWRVLAAALLFAVFLGGGLSSAQEPPVRKTPPRPSPAHTPVASADQSKFKGIWEPVNYPDDIFLHNVFFVSEKVGWAGGYSARAGGSDTGGVLIHAADGEEHWDLQLGDPESTQAGFYNLYFVDATAGLLNTTSCSARLMV